MSFDDVLSRLDGVRRHGDDRATTKCPGHDDRSASLSVRRGDDGRVLLNCFAGCSFAEVVGALGLEAAQLFPPTDRPWVPRRVRPDPERQAREAFELFASRFRPPAPDRLRDELRLIGLLLRGGTAAFAELPAGFEADRLTAPALRLVYVAMAELVRQGTPRRWFSARALAVELERAGRPRAERGELFTWARLALATVRGGERMSVAAAAERLGLMASAPASPPSCAAPGDADLLTLNETYFVIEEGGKHFVARVAVDPVRLRHVLKRYTFGEFKKRFPGQAHLASKWLDWAGRRQYLGGVDCDPTRSTPPDVFNLWRGFAVEARPGDWGILREHIRTVLCGDSGELTAYVLGWLARLVQYPGEPGEVVLVFRGVEGAGKSIVGNAVKKMFGQHAMAVATQRAVTGQFNAHLRDLVFLLANEAVFAGDRHGFSQLKALVTDETIFVEKKGIDGFEARNFIHLMMTTNAQWAVPVTLRDRRFAVLDVSPRRLGDRAYFRELHAAISDDAVIGAMLYDLQRHPLDGFEVRDIPATRARQEQMIQTLDGFDAWIRDILVRGDLGLGSPGWPEWAATSALVDSYGAWARAGRHRQDGNAVMLGQAVRRFFEQSRPRVDNPGRQQGYKLGTLDWARSRFCEVNGLPRDIFGDEEPVSS